MPVNSRCTRPVLTGALTLVLLSSGWSASGAGGKGLFSKYDPQAKALLGQMTVDEKIGQMLQPDQQFIKNIDDVETYHLGSVLSGGDSDPKSGNDLQSWTTMFNRFEARSLKSRLYIPTPLRG